MAQEINLVEIKDGYSQSNFNHNTKATIGAALNPIKPGLFRAPRSWGGT